MSFIRVERKIDRAYNNTYYYVEYTNITISRGSGVLVKDPLLAWAESVFTAPRETIRVMCNVVPTRCLASGQEERVLGRGDSVVGWRL